MSSIILGKIFCSDHTILPFVRMNFNSARGIRGITDIDTNKQIVVHNTILKIVIHNNERFLDSGADILSLMRTHRVSQMGDRWHIVGVRYAL